jgi:hypothetical protein
MHPPGSWFPLSLVMIGCPWWMQHSKEVQHAPLFLDKDDSADNRSCLRDRIHREIYALVISDHTS